MLIYFLLVGCFLSFYSLDHSSYISGVSSALSCAFFGRTQDYLFSENTKERKEKKILQEFIKEKGNTEASGKVVDIISLIRKGKQ